MYSQKKYVTLTEEEISRCLYLNKIYQTKKKQDYKPSSSDQVKQQMLALTLHLEITSREAAKFSHDLT